MNSGKTFSLGLKQLPFLVPPLRKRPEDINAFLERFSLEFTRSNDIRYRGFTPDAIRVLKDIVGLEMSES